MTSGSHSASRGIARTIILGILAVMLLGAIAGFLGAHESDREPISALGWIILGTMAIAFAVSAAIVARDIVRLLRGTAALPRRERATASLIAVSLVAGAASGLLLTVGPLPMEWVVGRRGAMPDGIAIGCASILLTVGPWLSLRWWRAIDEHERSAYLEGANVSGHFALFAGLGWWLLDRAALVPPPDVMVLILAMSAVWSAVWLYRKFY